MTSHVSGSDFSEPLNHTGALYLTVTIFSTVGFGDITPKADATRLMVSTQMILDLILLGVLIKLLTKAAKVGLGRGLAESG
jgi:voltage-gated potassium channel